MTRPESEKEVLAMLLEEAGLSPREIADKAGWEISWLMALLSGDKPFSNKNSARLDAHLPYSETRDRQASL